ncbi:MAG: carboxymuconolactone decarboxylase family protein [Anaerolineales bacterium]|nr:carboxymuconolactone decarboxylase family protein [Anaerolineales bacterium]
MLFDHPFKNRIFQLKDYIRFLNDAFSTMPILRQTARSGDFSKAFSERIMLAVTQVNGCRYCEYGHAKMALAAGVPELEIKQLLEGEFDQLPAEEIKGLLFAQHYAESSGLPDELACEALVDMYGVKTANSILAYARMIMIGNVLGNTFDALLYRLRFNPVPGSHVLDEIGILLGSFLLIPVIGLLQLLRHGIFPAARTEGLAR